MSSAKKLSKGKLIVAISLMIVAILCFAFLFWRLQAKPLEQNPESSETPSELPIVQGTGAEGDDNAEITIGD